MNKTLDDNFADYQPSGRAPLRYEVRRGREEAQRRGETFLEPPSTRNLLGELESWWAELTPEQRLGEAVGNLWQPELVAMGTLARGGQRFYSFLTKVLEEATQTRTLGGLKLGPSVTGGNILRRLQKLGVSKDELKYTGTEEVLRMYEKKPVSIDDLLEHARASELRLKVRELAFNEDYQKAELLDRMKEAERRQLDEWYRGVKEYKEDFPQKRLDALEKGEENLMRKRSKLMEQTPSHNEGYYRGYVLPSKTGFSTGYRERLYEPNLPKGVEVEFTHRPSYPRAFAHSRSRDLEVKIPGSDEPLFSRHAEEFQADTHQRVGGYLTGDPLKDTETIFDVARQVAGQGSISYWFREPALEATRFGVAVEIKGNRATLRRLNWKGADYDEILDEVKLKPGDSLAEKIVPFVKKHGLDPEPMIQNIKGQLVESEPVRLAADYPFKKDWWKVELKDQLMEAARDPNVKAFSFNGREVMSDRVGYTVYPKGTEMVYLKGTPGIGDGPYVSVNRHKMNTIPKAYTVEEFKEEFGKDLLTKVREEKIWRAEEDFPSAHGQFIDNLVEKKIPRWIEEEFGVKPVKGTTEVPYPNTSVKGVDEVPVWVIPMTDEFRQKLMKPQRLSWLSQQEREGLA